MKSSLYLNELGVISALGADTTAFARGLFADAIGGVAPCADFSDGPALHLGAVQAGLPDMSDYPLPLRSRNNALLRAALRQIRPACEATIAEHGPSRVAVVVGTSTSGIAEGEVAMEEYVRNGAFPPGYHYAQQELGSPSSFLASELGILGPAYTISTACSSSAKALASAARLLLTDAVDAVICGGADSLCRFTIAGFQSLELVSEARCNPLSRNRCGINIGEGAALFLLSRRESAVRLSGWGERSDAHHISAPDPEGRGARAAIEQALQRADISRAELDYVSLHGTATQQNDAVESHVVADLFGHEIPCSSIKPLLGHTLGAAGALGAAACWLSVHPDNLAQQLPVHWWDGERDPELAALQLVTPGFRAARRPRHALSNTFAFGGSNASLILSGA